MTKLTLETKRNKELSAKENEICL